MKAFFVKSKVHNCGYAAFHVNWTGFKGQDFNGFHSIGLVFRTLDTPCSFGFLDTGWFFRLWIIIRSNSFLNVDSGFFVLGCTLVNWISTGRIFIHIKKSGFS